MELTRDQMLRRDRELRELTEPVTGRWLEMSPTEAVVEAIRLEKELKAYLHDHKVTITVGGLIGLGKTAFTRILSYGLNIRGVYELDAKKDDVTDSLLHDFLLDKSRYCFDLQRHLLSKRLALREKSAAKRSSSIEDRTPEEDPIIFHQRFRQQGYLTDSQLNQLHDEAVDAYSQAHSSDLMLLLQGSAETARGRILRRGRPEELDAWTLEELRCLNRFYDTFPDKVQDYGLHRGPVLTFNVDKFDITNRIHEGFIYEQILNSLR